jgi:hypothetical protein
MYWFNEMNLSGLKGHRIDQEKLWILSGTSPSGFPILLSTF